MELYALLVRFFLSMSVSDGFGGCIMSFRSLLLGGSLCLCIGVICRCFRRGLVFCLYMVTAYSTYSNPSIYSNLPNLLLTNYSL